MNARLILICGLIAVPSMAMGQAPAPAVPEAAAPQPLPAPPAERLAAARELVAVIFPVNRREQMVTQTINAVNLSIAATIANSPFMRTGGVNNLEAQAALKDFVARRQTAAAALSTSEILPMVNALEHAYARRFTVEQMDEIRAFYLTPTGKVYGEQVQTLMADPDIVIWQQKLANRTRADAQRDVPGLVAKFKAIEAKTKAATKDKK